MTNLFRRQKSLSDMEEQTEREQAEDSSLGTKLSIARKRAAIAELRSRGLTAKHFGDTTVGQTWTRIFNWLKTH